MFELFLINLFFLGLLLNLSSHSFLICNPLSTEALQLLSMSLGTSNGLLFQFNSSLTFLTSSSPSGAPCVFSVPARFGEPNPIIVLQAINEGLLVFCAFSIAFDI